MVVYFFASVVHSVANFGPVFMVIFQFVVSNPIPYISI